MTTSAGNGRKRISLVPWNFFPRTSGEDIFGWTPFNALQREVNDLFDDFLPRSGSRATSGFVPSVSLKETEDSIQIEAELAGLNEKDVELSLTPEALVIRGEKKAEEQRKDEKGRVYNERSYGMFERTIPLSSEIDEASVDATFENGVLRVSLKKVKESRNGPKKIAIRGASSPGEVRP